MQVIKILFIALFLSAANASGPEKTIKCKYSTMILNTSETQMKLRDLKNQYKELDDETFELKLKDLFTIDEQKFESFKSTMKIGRRSAFSELEIRHALLLQLSHCF